MNKQTAMLFRVIDTIDKLRKDRGFMTFIRNLSDHKHEFSTYDGRIRISYLLGGYRNAEGGELSADLKGLAPYVTVLESLSLEDLADNAGDAVITELDQGLMINRMAINMLEREEIGVDVTFRPEESNGGDMDVPIVMFITQYFVL